MGIPISFMGAFWLMPYFDVSLNMISLFAFILALGIVVDDAIVVGENIFAYRQKGVGRLEAAILGVKEITAPVVMAILTTMLTFMPLLYITGVMGKFIRVIPIVVISILAFSLIEALLILPAHLSGKRMFKKKAKPGPIAAFQGSIRRKLDAFIYGPFAKLVARAIAWRYVTFAVAILVLMGTLGYIASGRIKFTMFPKVDADNVWASLSMPMGSTVAQTGEVVDKIEQAAMKVRKQIDLENDDPSHPSIFRHMSTTIGDQPLSRGGHSGPPADVGTGAHIAEVNVELLAGELRTISSSEIATRWREELGEVPGISSLTFTSDLFSAGDAINVELSCRDFDVLLEAVEKVKQILAEFDGVTDIDDSFEAGKGELKLALNDQGRILGLTLSDLARQVRQGFYGQEVQRIQRGRNDIRVMVRYPRDERKSISNIENMRLRLPDGTEIPFKAVAEVQQGRGYAVIRRSERKRVVNVSADVDSAVANANEINKSLREEILPSLQNDYPGLVFSFEGEQREQKEIRQSLGSSFAIAMLAVFALLAVQFRSYTQPLIIMSAIPFGLVGAIVGHIVMGFELSILSVFGIVALTGVVVNDSLIIIDLINRLRREGTALEEVMKASATRRFRPILLTTLTTFFGLVPMLMEKSLQARFLIPMAVSLAFGIVFATMITLLLVPSLYMVLEDIKSLPGRIFGKKVCDSDS
jgi:multidrug efflux pump subunit AcrB